MTVRPRRSLLAVAGAVACVLGSLAAGVPAAATPAAAPVFVGSGFRPVAGDVTGDGIGDRTTLGTLGEQCAFQVLPGTGRGQFGAAITGILPVASRAPIGPAHPCPNLGTVLRGPAPALDQLAVTWFDLGPSRAPLIQIFKGLGTGTAVRTGGLDGIYQPSVIASQDFDGNGYGDIWESTDQGGPTSFFVGRNSSWRPLSIYPREAFTSSEQFFDLNRAGGTDILTVWGDGGANDLGVAAVDGRTGAVQVLARTDLGDPAVSTSYAISVVDVNHDAYPDLRLVTTVYGAEPSPTSTVTTFLNRSQGGRWYFQARAS